MLDPNDLIPIVAADLEFLTEEWDGQVDDHSLRRSSTVIRRLLVDNELQRAWKAAGFDREPRIETSTLRPLLGRITPERIIFASAGGARYGGMELRGALVTDDAMAENQLGQLDQDGLPNEVIGLHSFIEAPCIIAEGRLVPRRVLIMFVANKLGGAHHDPKRGKTEEERIFKALDRASAEIRLLEKPAVYFELLSIGQALVASPDLRNFGARAREISGNG